jgi:hypothetical protein
MAASAIRIFQEGRKTEPKSSSSIPERADLQRPSQPGLDIAFAKYSGASLSFDLPCGEAHPAHTDPHGIGGLRRLHRAAPTCGLTWAGAMCEDEEPPRAFTVAIPNSPPLLKIGDAGRRPPPSVVTGEIRESVLRGCNIVMRRTITTEVGLYTIHIEDSVSNEGLSETPHMMNNHINYRFSRAHRAYPTHPNPRRLSPARGRGKAFRTRSFENPS